MNLAWLADELPSALQALGATVGRLSEALILGVGIGGVLAWLMRRSERTEALLTPFLLMALAVPWLLVLVAINLIPSLGIRDGTAIGIAATACAVQIFALGRSKLEEARSLYLYRALWYCFGAVIVSELLARGDGLGAKLRFFALYTDYPHLFLYIFLIIAFWIGFSLLARLLTRQLGRTFLGRGR